jgi:uncharacterized protein
MSQRARKSAFLFYLHLLLIAACTGSAAGAGTTEEAEAAYRRGDYAAAREILRPLADAGDVRAEFLLGVLYSKGQAVPQNFYEAAKWYRKAATKGHAPSQTALGLSYELGRGVERDFADASTWYRKAADQGDLEGQYYLAQMYESGYGVPQDYVLAHLWFELASGGQPIRPEAVELRRRAKQRLATLDFKMTPEQIAEAKDLAREWKPAPPAY